MTISGINPWVSGQISPAWNITCQRADPINGVSAVNLTGLLAANISILFYNNVLTASVNGLPSYTQIATGAGALSIVTAASGIISYTPAGADTSGLTPGQYWVRVQVNMNGTQPDYSDYIPLFIAK